MGNHQLPSPAWSQVQAIGASGGDIDLYVNTFDCSVYTSMFRSGSWSDWIKLPGFTCATGNLTVVGQPGTVDIYAIAPDNHNEMRAMTQYVRPGQEWTWFNDVGPSLPGGAQFLSNGDVTAVGSPGNLTVFALDTSGNVFTAYYNDTNAAWSNWAAVPFVIDSNGRGIASPYATKATAVGSPNAVDLFVSGTDGKVYTAYYRSDTHWLGWFPISVTNGGVFSGNVNAVQATPCVSDCETSLADMFQFLESSVSCFEAVAPFFGVSPPAGVAAITAAAEAAGSCESAGSNFFQIVSR